MRKLLPLHLLAALIEDKEGIVPPVLEKIGIGPQAVLNDLYKEIDRLPKVSGESAQPAMSPAVNQLLERAFKEAANFKDEYVSTEHLLLAATQTKRSAAQEILGPPRRDLRSDFESADRGAWFAESYGSESGSEVSGPGALCARSDGAGAAGKARSGNWAG